VNKYEEGMRMIGMMQNNIKQSIRQQRGRGLEMDSHQFASGTPWMPNQKIIGQERLISAALQGSNVSAHKDRFR
jgi:hypothetical protein